jgi:oligoribonuclease NrnB/cAMP/cGMP phosphodiesterase (DHH superfamily)
MADGFSKPEVILTHESDLDGLVAGVLLRRLAKRLFDVDVRIEACNYNYWRQRDLRETAGWVTDLGFEPRVDKPNWLVVDHHVTDTVPKQARLIHDVSKSASLLCYEICTEHGLGSPQLERLVHLTNVADLFLADDPEFELANDYANLVKNYQFWNVYALVEGGIEKLVDHPLLEVMAVKRRIEDPLGLEWSRKNVVELGPTVGFVDTVVGNTNLIVHKLLEQQATKYSVLVTMMRKANGVVIASFRSRNGDALKVAERFQGGGHANACGATLPKSVRSIGDAVQYMRQVLAPKPPPPGTSLEELFDQIETGR